MEEQYIYNCTRGDKFYYKDEAKTIFHRLDGPAIEWADGSKEWDVNGKRHREDGPAIEWANGDRSWYVNGVYIMTVDKEGTVVDRM
jgi:hypothetical protein